MTAKFDLFISQYNWIYALLLPYYFYVSFWLIEMGNGRKKTNKSSPESDCVSVTLEDDPAEMVQVLKDMESTLKKVVSGQDQVERRLASLESKFDKYDKKFNELEKAIGFYSEEPQDVKESVSDIKETLKQENKTISSQASQIDSLRSQLDQLERYSRNFNLRNSYDVPIDLQFWETE